MSALSTPEGWIALRQLVKQSASLQQSPTQTIELRICAALTFLSGLLYAASFLKRRSGGMWICRKDAQGYCHPTFTQLCRLLRYGRYCRGARRKELKLCSGSDTYYIAARSLSGASSFCLAKIWAILYALISSRLRRRKNKGGSSRTRQIVPPWLFNTFVSATITAVILGQIPLIVLLSRSIHKFRNQFDVSDLLFQQAASMSSSTTQDSDSGSEVAVQAILNLTILEKEGLTINQLFLAYIVFTISWMSFNILVYAVSAGFLLNALRSQKNTLSSALENRKVLRLIQESAREEAKARDSCKSWVFCSSEEEEVPGSTKGHRSFDPWTWKSWVDFARDESMNGEAFWDGIGQLNLPVRSSRANLEDAFAVGEKSTRADHARINDSALQMHWTTTTRYWYSTMGQTIVGLGMFSSYLIMGCWLLVNRSIFAGVDQLIEAFIWSNWTWGGGPGLMLGIVACIVAFSPTPALPQGAKTRNPTPSTAGSRSGKGRPIWKSKWDGISGGAALVTDQSDNLSIAGSAWRRPSLDSYKSSKNKLVLSRQASFDSSIFKHVAGHYEMAHKATTEDLSWGKSERSQQEDLVETEWIAGNFDAIKGLRNG
ncbi:hypothetical protein KEM48_012076 [Puccinia striiformis f. sp. tritici PST-130]|nr:hypothetical protein KEM48_012076 [Puccinia striiformis f. sp. tritici PST-130]